ncbi:MAG: PAS domain-containing protein [Phycisphaerales bacterium]
MARRNGKERPAAGSAKAKAAPGAESPEPAGARRAAGATPESPGVLDSAATRRDVVVPLLVLLAVAATAYIWLETPLAHRAPWKVGGRVDQTTLQGVALSAIVWIVALAGLLARIQSGRTVKALKALIAHAEAVRARLSPNITEAQSGLRMRYVSAWLVAILGLAASAIVWQTDAIERAVGAELSAPVVGAVFSVALALAVAANVINRLKTRRLTRDFRAALASERLALDTLGSLDVMTSACLLTGERTRFNERFLKFLGLSEAQAQGLGWLEAVHPDERDPVIELLKKPLGDKERVREHDVCVRYRDGRFVWIHETLVPRFDAAGEPIEFIGTAVDVTPHVESAAAMDKQVGDAKADLARANGELAEAKGELAKLRASRGRNEAAANEARDEAKNLQQALTKAEAALEKTRADAAAQIDRLTADAEERAAAAEQESKQRTAAAESDAKQRIAAALESAESRVARAEKSADARTGTLDAGLKAARQEAQEAAAEAKRATRALETQQAEMTRLREGNGTLKEQVARHLIETREASATASAVQANESQNLARADRLTKRCEELEAQLVARVAELAARDESLAASQEQARLAAESAAVQAESRAKETSAEALAKQLRTQLDGVQRMTDAMLAEVVDGPARDAAKNSAAAVRGMIELIDGALHGARAVEVKHSATAATFDLRRTAESVRDLLAGDAKARGVTLNVESTNLRLVYGDEEAVRGAFIALAGAALGLANEGTLTVRLTEDAGTGAHAAIRAELKHASARVKNDALEQRLAMKATDDAMPDPAKEPAAHQAAQAWRALRGMQGQHGYMLPDEGGFSVWFTFTLGRPAAAAGVTDAAAAAAPSERSRSTATEPGADSTDAGTPRTLPRMPQEQLRCNLGDVVELGADSLRVMGAKPPKEGETVITFEGVEMDGELRAELLWSKKVGGRQHDVGLRLLNPTPAQQKWLLAIAMQHRRIAPAMEVEPA